MLSTVSIYKKSYAINAMIIIFHSFKFQLKLPPLPKASIVLLNVSLLTFCYNNFSSKFIFHRVFLFSSNFIILQDFHYLISHILLLENILGCFLLSKSFPIWRQMISCKITESIVNAKTFLHYLNCSLSLYIDLLSVECFSPPIQPWPDIIPIFPPTYSDMLRFVVIVELQSQRPYGYVVREKRLFSYNPNVACICHIVQSSVPKNDSSIFLAVRFKVASFERKRCFKAEWQRWKWTRKEKAHLTTLYNIRELCQNDDTSLCNCR